MERVPLLDLKAQHGTLREEIYAALRPVVESQGFVLGPSVAALEREIAARVGVAHGVGVASGTDALILSLAALGVGEKHECIAPAFSFFATASCAVRVGARPVFADIEPGSFNLDPESVERALTPRTGAIIPVHLFGQCADLAPLLSLASDRRVPVVEDACQALGAEHVSDRTGSRQQAGSLGRIGCFSFYPTKNLGGFGDGGLVVTDDDDLASRVRSLRSHGQSAPYLHSRVGWNSRLDELQAAVLRVKLPHLDDWSRRRFENASSYDRLFREAGLPESENVILPARVPYSTHIFNQYTIRARSRDRLSEYLREREIGHAVYYPAPLHLQECFRDLGHREGDFPESERACREVLSLPIYAELTSAAQERVVGAIADFYRDRS